MSAQQWCAVIFGSGIALSMLGMTAAWIRPERKAEVERLRERNAELRRLT